MPLEKIAMKVITIPVHVHSGSVRIFISVYYSYHVLNSFLQLVICILDLVPVGFAIVSEETADNWQWFLEHLREAIGTHRELVLVSDGNHGILER